MNISNILRLAAAASLFAACQSASYKITGEGDALVAGDSIFFTNDLNTGKPFAATVVSNGQFSIEGLINKPTMSIAYSKNHPKCNVTFFTEPGSIKLNMSTKSPNRVSGTTMNDKWQVINDSTYDIGVEINRIATFIYQSASDITAEERDSAEKRINALQDRFKTFIRKYAADNITNDFGSFMLVYYKTLFQPKEILDLTAKMTDDQLADDNIKSLIGEMKIKANAGEGGKMPDFEMEDIDGNKVKLLTEASRHKLTIIDFWASWCGPCRAEMPNLVKLYSDLKDQGLGIIGISLDDNKEKWTDAVNRLDMKWLQLSDLKGWKNHIATSLGVTSIPHTIVIDPEGNILAAGLRGDNMSQFITERLNH